MYKHISIIIILMLMIFTPLVVKAQIIAVNTDVVADACLAPSLGVELGMSPRSTLAVNALHGSNILGKDNKITAIQPEWRFYFSGRPMYHHFVGIGLIGASYDLKVDDRIYNGDGAGAGVTFGYALPLGKRWNVDFHAGCGMFFYRQKEYHINEDPAQFNDNGREVANSHGTSIVPTRIGISISYIIK